MEGKMNNSFVFKGLIGRGGEIRTHDPLRPRQVRYQAALRPDLIHSTSLPKREPLGVLGVLIRTRLLFSENSAPLYQKPFKWNQ
jgi:hypothetical protein